MNKTIGLFSKSNVICEWFIVQRFSIETSIKKKQSPDTTNTSLSMWKSLYFWNCINFDLARKGRHRKNTLIGHKVTDNKYGTNLTTKTIPPLKVDEKIFVCVFSRKTHDKNKWTKSEKMSKYCLYIKQIAATNNEQQHIECDGKNTPNKMECFDISYQFMTLWANRWIDNAIENNQELTKYNRSAYITTPFLLLFVVFASLFVWLIQANNTNCPAH